MLLLWLALTARAGAPLADAAELSARAEVAFAEGRYAEAEALEREALALKRGALPPGDPSIGESLSDIAATLHVRGDLDAAAALYAQARELLAPVGGDAWESLRNNEGALLFSLGRYAEADAALRDALAAREARVGPDDPDLLATLGNLGEARARLGDPEGALALQRRALAIAEAHAMPVEAAGIRLDLGKLALDTDPAEAEALAGEALVVLEAAWRGPHPTKALARDLLAHAVERRGDLDRAEALFRLACDELGAALGERNAERGACLDNLARVRQERGDLLGARALREQSLAVQEAALGPDHPRLRTVYANQGALLRKIGDTAGARRYLSRALELTPPTEIGDLAEILGGLALIEPDPRGALDAWEGALALYALVPSRALEAATAHVHAAAVAVAAGEDDLARAHRDAARELLAALGPSREKASLTTALATQAILDGATADGAVAALREAVAAEREATGAPSSQGLLLLGSLETAMADPAGEAHVAEALAREDAAVVALLGATSERERLAALSARRLFLDALLSTREDAWDAVLRWKGLVARTLAAERAVDDPALAELAAARAAYAAAAWAKDADPARVRALADAKEGLERVVAERSEPSSVVALRGADVCAALPPDTALVDVVRYHRLPLLGEVSGPVYAAFVARGCDVRRVELGDATTLERHVRSFRALASAPESDPETLALVGGRLRAALWDPLADAVGDAPRVLFVPDGALAGVPLGALPTETGVLLQERLFVYLDGAHRALEADRPRGRGALLVGGVDYGATVAAEPCFGDGFDPLPGTAEEIAAVKAALGPVRILKGAKATEAALARHAPGKRVVHLATHGFFAAGRCRSALDGDGVGLSPMVLTGLAVSGANSRSDGAGGDGLWTAEEVSALDLSAAELVVLSACASGLGEIVDGEGVLGLRRAVATAGAGALVTSLWAVPDAPTAALMAATYGELATGGTPAEALRRAQLAAWERGAPASDWAAWVASGR